MWRYKTLIFGADGLVSPACERWSKAAHQSQNWILPKGKLKILRWANTLVSTLAKTLTRADSARCEHTNTMIHHRLTREVRKDGSQHCNPCVE